MNMFEYAARNKLRFASIKGQLTVEELWDVPLRSSNDFNLNVVAQATNRALKAAGEEDFVRTELKPEQTRLKMAMDIVLHVIEVKKAEEEAAKKSADNRARKNRLLEVLAQKQDGKLAEMSEEDLRKEIEALS